MLLLRRRPHGYGACGRTGGANTPPRDACRVVAAVFRNRPTESMTLESSGTASCCISPSNGMDWPLDQQRRPTTPSHALRTTQQALQRRHIVGCDAQELSQTCSGHLSIHAEPEQVGCPNEEEVNLALPDNHVNVASVDAELFVVAEAAAPIADAGRHCREHGLGFLLGVKVTHI